MTWNRLELHARSRDLDPGLAAHTADPLWMLARQWQFGEFQGEDTGSPVSVILEATIARPAAYRGIAAGDRRRDPFPFASRGTPRGRGRERSRGRRTGGLGPQR